MPSRSPRRRGDARETVLSLFSHPPINEADLSSRLRAVDPVAAGDCLVELLEGGAIPDEQGMIFVAAAARLDLEGHGERLSRVALDRARSPGTRLLAFLAITGDDPDGIPDLARRISPEEMAAMTEVYLMQMLVANPAACAETVEDVLVGLPDDGCREAFFAGFDPARRGLGLLACRAYARAVHNRELDALRPRLLAAIVDEASPAGVPLLEDLRNRLPSEEREIMAALLRLRSRLIEPGRREEPARGRAWIGNCDGQGLFPVVASLGDADGTVGIATACLRVNGGIWDASLAHRKSPADPGRILESMGLEAGAVFVEVAVDVASAVVTEAARRGRAAGKSLSDEAYSVITALGMEAEHPDPRERRDVMRVASDEEVAWLLARPEYEKWFFDEGDLRSVGVRLPARKAATAGWLERSASRVMRSPLGARVSAMAFHMARWHAWRGDSDASALCAGLAAAGPGDTGLSSLVRHMLERSAKRGRCGEDAPLVPGDTAERQWLKLVLFSAVRKPRCLDMARLDFTQAALHGISRGFEKLKAAELRPSEARRAQAALAVGSRCVDALTKGRGYPMDYIGNPALFEEAAMEMADICEVDKRDCHEIVLSAFQAVTDFFVAVCSSCAVRCLSNPNRRADSLFFSPGHPAVDRAHAPGR